MALDLQRFPILVVDDEEDNLDAFRFNFKKSFQVLTAMGGDEALKILESDDVAVIVTDQRMPKMSGLELLRAARSLRPDAVGIILTAYTDVEVLIESINLGQIYRYITKPWDGKEVRGILQQAIERFHLVRENRRLEESLRQYAGYLNQEIHGQFDFGAIIGDSAALREVLARVEQVAPTVSTVLLRGETGTGKELVAHAIHINSPREQGPFVRVNCAALAPGVLESELFGHEKGAFTGAIARRPGRFELADGGTLFLDEVGDLPMEVQIKLLRTLQEREFERVGGTETIKVDVRVVSATNRDLESMIRDARFREDLYYRLNVFPIHLPPLRERIDDISKLVEHFVAKFARRAAKQVRGFSQDAIALLQSYPWPGNVRELENVVERAIIVARSAEMTAADLDFGRRGMGGPIPTLPASVPSAMAPSSAAQGAQGGMPVTPLSGQASGGTANRPLAARLLEEEKREIVAAVERASGNIARAARALGINRSTLYYRMRKHGLDHLLPTKLVGPGEEEPSGDTVN
ncbi:MAG: sigma-54-dependent Fis family transcriptional regulator [Deltaproteobacteria bacterium]|nr:sigma-54-dependent Fis family transcriptional regulator [Deltaproteobacteria bacterium]